MEKEINIKELYIGQKVRYQPDYYDNKWENGIIKEIPHFAYDKNAVVGANSVRVVYNCSDNWERYTDYTAALTNIRDLKLGWK